MEVMDLQASSVYKSKHEESSLQDFYKCLHKKEFKNLLTLAKQMFSLFGITIICKQKFSVMKLNENKLRSLLADGHLEDIFKMSGSSIAPIYDVLVANKHFSLKLYF